MTKILKVVNIDGRFEFVGKDYPKEFVDFFNMCAETTLDGISGIIDAKVVVSTAGIPCICTIMETGHKNFIVSSTTHAMHNLMGECDERVLSIPKFNIDDDIQGNVIDMQITQCNKDKTYE